MCHTTSGPEHLSFNITSSFSECSIKDITVLVHFMHVLVHRMSQMWTRTWKCTNQSYAQQQSLLGLGLDYVQVQDRHFMIKTNKKKSQKLHQDQPFKTNTIITSLNWF